MGAGGPWGPLDSLEQRGSEKGRQRETGRLIGGRTERERGGPWEGAESQRGRQTEGQEGQRGRQTWQTGRQTDRQASRHADGGRAAEAGRGHQADIGIGRYSNRRPLNPYKLQSLHNCMAAQSLDPWTFD